MDHNDFYRVKSLLKAGSDLDVHANTFLELLFVEGGDFDIHDNCVVERRDGDREVLIKAHRLSFILSYAHVVETKDGTKELFGQFQLYRLGDDDRKSGDIVWLFQFNRYGDTSFPHPFAHLNVHQHEQLNFQREVKYRIIEAIQNLISPLAAVSSAHPV